MRRIEATQYTGFPLLLKGPHEVSLVDIEPISKGDEVVIYGISWLVEEVLEKRKPKGDYGEFSDKVIFYRLKVS